MKFYTLLLIFIFLQGCDLKVANRSGTIADDYVEEPLSERSVQYELALNTSNKIMALIRDGRCDDIYKNLLSGKAKESLPFDSFKSMCQGLVSNYGNLIKYKPQQWHFFNKTEGDNEYLMSIKLAEHERLMVSYALVFPLNGKYDKIVGIHLKARQGVVPPGVF